MRRLLANDPQQEAQAQGVLLDRLEARFSREFQAEIKRAMGDMVASYERTGSLPLSNIEHMRRIESLYLDLSAISIDVFGGRIVDQGKSYGLILETKDFAEFFQILAEQYIQMEAIRRRITSVSETTRKQIIDLIDKGNAEGNGIAAIAKSITDTIPYLSRWRASVIARTETHGAANYGANEAAKSTGLKLKKEWISVEDHRTRDFYHHDAYDHRAMNGQVVDMDQPFSMPWSKGDPLQIMYPGQADMPAAAVINCRCAVGHIVDEASLFD